MSDIKVLVALHSSAKSREIQQTLEPLNRIKIFESKDGVDTLFKISNAIPKVLLIEEHLPRRSGSHICEWVLKQKNLTDVAMILVTDKTDNSNFVEAVSLGRMQYVSPEMDPITIKVALLKALNFAIGAQNQDFRVRLVAAGEVLIKEGDQADSVFLVRSGQLKAVRNDNQVLGQIMQGEFVGEMAYINQEMRSATVVAETDAELVEIPIQNVDMILSQKPSWAKALIKTLSKRLKISNRKAA